jgi:hypothetical protein
LLRSLLHGRAPCLREGVVARESFGFFRDSGAAIVEALHGAESLVVFFSVFVEREREIGRCPWSVAFVRLEAHFFRRLSRFFFSLSRSTAQQRSTAATNMEKKTFSALSPGAKDKQTPLILA